MSSILDTITGGGILPHVYCKKVTLERNPNDTSLTDVTLSLELYQEKNTLLKSTWLNDLNSSGMNFLDALCIQVVPFKTLENVKKLLPSNQPTGQLPDAGNVYVAKEQYGDNYLPRGDLAEGHGSGLGSKKNYKVFAEETKYVPMFGSWMPLAPPAPMQISNSSILGGLSNMDTLSNTIKEGKIREENIDGKVYYILPFPWKTTFDENEQDKNSLGFLFYTFLHVPLWIREAFDSEIYESFDQQFFEEFVVEGPVNSEVVFMNGQVRKIRETFFLPNGAPWEGSVHLHTSENQAPSGYFGDGGFSGTPQVNQETGDIINLGSDYRGWMVGETHYSSTLPKLKLLEVPNDKIVDFRSGLFSEPLDTAVGIGTPQEVFNLSSKVAMLEEHFLSPFQKEKRKDFIRDKDSEFSKLYVCRDSKNNARGIFFINFLELLKNNSTLFPLMFGKKFTAKNMIDVVGILQKSKILQLRVYRDRVKEKTIGTRYDNFANGEFFEEPSKLIGVIGDMVGFKTPNQNDRLTEIDGIASPAIQTEAFTTSFTTRYFMFSDKEISKQNAGLYRYRIELDFKDGTYEFLYKLFQRLNRTKIVLDQYYDLSVSTFTNIQEAGLPFDQLLIPDKYSKAIFKKYYHEGFVPEFLEKVNKLTAAPSEGTSADWPFKPWSSTISALDRVQNIFGIFPKIDSWSEENQEWKQEELSFKDDTFKNMISPTKGSPPGINFFSRMLQISITKVESLLGATKVNKTGSELDVTTIPDGYSLNQMLDVEVSAGDFTIKEHYSFDSPNELFEAVDNSNIYVDYFSIGVPMTTGFIGIKPIRTDFFKDRCRLEAAKFSPIAQTEAGFNGTDVGLYSSPPAADGASWSIRSSNSDKMSLTGYSYLAPSMVRIASPLNKGKNYNFYYNVFKTNARTYLDGSVSDGKKLFNPNFVDPLNYDKVFISLKNYSMNKEETKYADLSDGFAGVEDESIPGILPSIKTSPLGETILNHREPYKKSFEKMGITLHSQDSYLLFFNKEPGAVHKNSPFNYPLSLKEFSDGHLMPVAFMKKMIYNNNQNVVKLTYNSPAPTAYGATIQIVDGPPTNPGQIPNSFKIWAIEQNRNSTINTSIVHPELKKFFDDPLSLSLNPFFYFNVNLTSKVEVFRGIPSNTDVSKNDENAWSLLTQSDLELAKEDKLFCRLSLYDESLKKGMRLPIIDKYFLVYNDATLHIPLLLTFPNEMAILSAAESNSVGSSLNSVIVPGTVGPNVNLSNLTAAKDITSDSVLPPPVSLDTY